MGDKDDGTMTPRVDRIEIAEAPEISVTTPAHIAAGHQRGLVATTLRVGVGATIADGDRLVVTVEREAIRAVRGPLPHEERGARAAIDAAIATLIEARRMLPESA